MTPDDGFLPLFLKRAAAAPDAPFARDADGTLTFGALHRASDGLAAGLARRGIGAGSRVAAMLRNGRLPIVLLHAIAKLGAVWVPVNPQARGPGLRYVLDHAEPALLVAEPDLLPTIAEAGAPVPVIAADGAEIAGWIASGDAFAAALPDAAAPFGILYTSGTTGHPKGVILTHRMMRLAGEAVLLVSLVRDGDVMLVWEPMAHIGGAQLIVVPLLRDVVLALVPGFSASRFWEQAAEAGATHVHYLGGVLQILMKQPPGPRDRAHGVRIAWGAACPAAQWRAIEQRFGLTIRECYGMTEASSITTINTDGTPGAVGRPVPWFEVELRDAQGRLAERGEIRVRSSDPGALTPGYFRNPDATARAFSDGWLRTGDAAHRDAAGNLVYAGRLSDNVRVRGENVSALEVEEVASAHPAVESCAMVGVAAEIGEQEIKLFIKPRAGAQVTEAALAAWLGERLAPYQVPRYIAFVLDFPRTPSERIRKHALPAGTAGCWDRQAAARRTA